jgi:hypothetical protein
MIRTIGSVAALRAIAILIFSVIISGCGAGSGGSSSTGSAATSTPLEVGTKPATSSESGASATLQLSTSNYSAAQSAGSVTITVRRTDGSSSAVTVDYDTADGTAVAGTDYTATSGTLEWAENDTTDKSISVPISTTAPFSGSRSFDIVLSNPSASAQLGNPGSATVSIAGAASAGVGTISLADSNLSIAQNGGSITVSVTRSGGAVGATSVSYSTLNGTAVAGTDYTRTEGVLEWADADATDKSFSIPVLNTKSFSGDKTFQVTISNPTAGAVLGDTDNANVTLVGSSTAASGTFQLSAANYPVAQSSGSLTITVNRVNGSAGAASVAYATKSGTATSGTDFTGSSGTLKWTDGDAGAKTFNIAISNTTAFTGSRTFSILLSSPSVGAKISAPSTATATITGSAAAPTGNLQLTASSYSVSQSAGSLNVSVSRTNGSHGTTSVAYVTADGTAVGGTDFTSTTGTLNWTDGDTATKSFAVAISAAKAFAGAKSFTVKLSNPGNGAALGSPSSASVTVNGSAVGAAGNLQLSAANFTATQSAGRLVLTVNRTGGSAGAVTVKYSTSDGTAAAGTDYTAMSGTLQWASNDAAAKTIPVPVSNATPFTGTRSFNVALTSPTGGASVTSPGSAVANITGSGAASSGSTFWVFQGGVFNWGGDYSFGATPNYKDTGGSPVSGAYDIAVTITTAYGGFLPFAGGTVPLWNFDASPYNYLTFAFKPTVANQTLQVYFVKVGDIPVGVDVNPFNGKYGPAPQVGVWGTYRIPLSDLGVKNTSVYKFALQDMTGLSHNVFYVDNIGFN